MNIEPDTERLVRARASWRCALPAEWPSLGLDYLFVVQRVWTFALHFEHPVVEAPDCVWPHYFHCWRLAFAS